LVRARARAADVFLRRARRGGRRSNAPAPSRGEFNVPKLAANLSMMFNEVAFLDRFAAAAAAGFRAVEFLFPYDHEPPVVAGRLRAAGLFAALFNFPPGDWSAGERGIAALAGREAEFAAGIERGLTYAQALGCPIVHAMAGFAADDDERTIATYIANVRAAADAFAPAGKRIAIEPINHRDMPGYFLHTTAQAAALIEKIDRPNVALQLDLYHAQISEGDLEYKIRALSALTAHVQIAGNPARHEPDIGEVNYRYLLGVLDEVGYAGWIGCEYRPAVETTAGLGWAKPYLT
jgi:2-dehydrotetronate isomerase